MRIEAGTEQDVDSWMSLVEKVKNEIAECGLSATEAKGFLEYMKIVIDAQSHLPIQK